MAIPIIRVNIPEAFMQNRPLLSSLWWRIVLWIVFAILLIAIGYAVSMLFTAFNQGMPV